MASLMQRCCQQQRSSNPITFLARPSTRLPNPLYARTPTPRPYARKASKPPTRTSKPPSPPPTRPPPSPYQNDLASYTSILAAKSSPTLLFQAPAWTSYPMACYTIGGFCCAYGLYNLYDTFLIPHPGLAWPVPYMMGGTCVFMLACGGYLGWGASRLVQSITAVPIKGQGLGAGVGGRGRGILVQIERSQRIPWIQSRVLELQPAELYLQTGVEAARQAYGADDDMMRTGLSAAEKRAAREKYLDSVSNPFRHLLVTLSKPFRWFFWLIRRAVTREGFAKLKAGRSLWLLDVKYGWTLDGGLALERLMKGRQ
ncbi:MAG: hypothetical protein M1828_004701 [Chrysothrix sp. TS-e1954]|nr:MAG: hypothetical protein M1828_004701 [Chrysothrix sp. TS-e1954]